MNIVSGYTPGCIGRVASLHAEYYSRHAGFGRAFEAKVARELAALCESFVEGRDGLWFAVEDGVIEGSIAIDGSSPEGAHLRWFLVSDKLRGKGAGNFLLSLAMEFCRRNGFTRVDLWTFEGLAAARHLYEKAGFRLVHQQKGMRWGSEVNEQQFEWLSRPLSRAP